MKNNKKIAPCPNCSTEGVEVCLGCGKAYTEEGAELLKQSYRDCGCPAGSGYVCPNSKCKGKKNGK